MAMKFLGKKFAGEHWGSHRTDTHGLRSLQEDKARHQAQQGERASATPGLITLPTELQLIILSSLDLADLLTLRRTCRLYLYLITQDLIISRALSSIASSPPFLDALRCCCIECLCTPGRANLVLDLLEIDDRQRIGSSAIWCSVCLQCWRPRQTLALERGRGSLVQLATGSSAQPCGICGWIVSGSVPAVPGLRGRWEWKRGMRACHPGWCLVVRRVVVIAWYLLGFINFSLGIGAVAAAWALEGGDSVTVIRAITATNFALVCVNCIITWVPKDLKQKPKNFAWMLVPNVAAAILWVPVLIAVAKEFSEFVDDDLEDNSFVIFAVSMFAVNLLFRVLDSVGYALLLFDYDPRNPYIPGLTSPRKGLYVLNTLFTYWAYPHLALK